MRMRLIELILEVLDDLSVKEYHEFIYKLQKKHDEIDSTQKKKASSVARKRQPK